MIIALSQLNSTVGDLNGNADLITDAIRKTKGKADIIVFPEMSLTGYPAKDLIFDSDFMKSTHEILVEISLIAIVINHHQVQVELFNVITIFIQLQPGL